MPEVEAGGGSLARSARVCISGCRGWKEGRGLKAEHVIPLNSDASSSPRVSSRYQRTLTTMVGRYATPEADITITRHLPPPDDDSAQDVSMSFDIPLQADASNLLDQNCDDFFSGPGFVTLSTPVLPRHLMNNGRSVRRATGTIQTPAVAPGTILGRAFTTFPTTELEASDNRTELHETHTSPIQSPSPPGTPFIPPGPPATVSVVGSTDRGSSRPGDVSSGSNPDTKLHGGPKSNTAPSMASIIITKECGTYPDIQSTSTSIPSHHPTNAKNTQISRQPPIPVPQSKDREPARSRGNGGVKSDQVGSKPRGGGGLDCNITTSVSRVQLFQPSWDIRISG